MCASSDHKSSATLIYVNYANYLTQLGHGVTLIFPNKFKLANGCDPRVQLIFTPGWMSKIRGIPYLYNPIHGAFHTFHTTKVRYDIIHTSAGHRPAHFIPAFTAKLSRGTRLVDEWWEWFGREGLGRNPKGARAAGFAFLEDLLELRTKFLYDKILPITYTLKNRLSERVQSRCEVLHGGVDTEGLVPHSKQEARRLLNLSPSDVIVGLCNVCKEDHIDNEPFFRSINAVAAKFSNLKLLVSGQKEYIDTKITAIIPSARLINIGWQPYDKYNQYLSACDCFALPFPGTPRNAGRWPNKIGDYLWLKRPVITNPTADIRSFMEKNPCLGFCVEATEHGYASALSVVCEKGANAANEYTGDFIGKAGLLTVSQRQARILNIYQELLKDD